MAEVEMVVLDREEVFQTLNFSSGRLVREDDLEPGAEMNEVRLCLRNGIWVMDGPPLEVVLDQVPIVERPDGELVKFWYHHDARQPQLLPLEFFTALEVELGHLRPGVSSKMFITNNW